jgi:hypothetical protein
MNSVSPNPPEEEALRLLVQMCLHRANEAPDDEEALRVEEMATLLTSASSLHEARDHLAERLARLLPESLSAHLVAYVHDLIEQVIEADGRIASLIAGQSDSIHHLCRVCGVNEAVVSAIPFFRHHARRSLLVPEAQGVICCHCQQPLVPVAQVVLVQSGTQTHVPDCTCGSCNQAHRASVLHIYQVDAQTGLQLPFLHRLCAPSPRQCIAQAIQYCGHAGWYMLNKGLVGKTRRMAS